MDAVVRGYKVHVVKAYDHDDAREVFGHMSDSAKVFLWQSLKPEKIYDAANLPAGIEYDAFLLDEMLDKRREE